MAFVRPHAPFPFELLSENWPDPHLQSILSSRESNHVQSGLRPAVKSPPLPLAGSPQGSSGSLGRSNQVFTAVSQELYVLVTLSHLVTERRAGLLHGAVG